MVRLHEQVDTLDLIPFLPSGTTGPCWLLRQGNVVTVQSDRVTLPAGTGSIPNITLPQGWAPARPAMLLMHLWDSTAVRVMQYQMWARAFRAADSGGFQYGTNGILFGSWIV